MDVKPYQHIFVSQGTRLQQQRRARQAASEDSAKGSGEGGGHLMSGKPAPGASDVSASDLGEEGGSHKGERRRRVVVLGRARLYRGVGRWHECHGGQVAPSEPQAQRGRGLGQAWCQRRERRAGLTRVSVVAVQLFFLGGKRVVLQPRACDDAPWRASAGDGLSQKVAHINRQVGNAQAARG